MCPGDDSSIFIFLLAEDPRVPRRGGVEHGWETRPFPPYECQTGFRLTV